MPEDRTTLTADGTEYFDVMRRASKAGDDVSGSGERIGQGFLKSERAARTATRNIVIGLSTVSDATSGAIIVAQGLERVFKIGILPTVLLAGGLAAVEAINRVLEKERKLRDEIHQLKLESNLGADFLSTDQINQNLTNTGKKIDEVVADIIKLRGGFMKLGPIDLLGSETREGFLKADEEKLAELRATAINDVLKLTSKQNDLNRVEQERLDGMEDMADLDKAEIESNERLGKLSEAMKSAAIQETEAAKQLLSTEKDRLEINKQILQKKQQAAQTKSLETTGDFFADVGSGRFAKTFAESQQRDLEARRGQALIDEIRAGQSRGFFQDPLSQAMLKVAERLGAKAQTGLQALIDADYSNLLLLSKYDFSGLAPLSNLTIQIQ